MTKNPFSVIKQKQKGHFHNHNSPNPTSNPQNHDCPFFIEGPTNGQDYAFDRRTYFEVGMIGFDRRKKIQTLLFFH